MTKEQRQATREAQVIAWLNDNKSGDVCSWTELFMEMGIPGSTYDILVSELTKLIASIEAATLEEAAEVAPRYDTTEHFAKWLAEKAQERRA